MPIRVRVLYFGQARDAAGTTEELVSLPIGSQVGALLDRSMRAHRQLQAMAGVLRVALNEEVASMDERLAEGDVVAFLPPVAGG